MTGPLKWHGGKHDLAKWIISLMPPRCKTSNSPRPDDDGWLHYVEPYFGGGSVLLANDPEGISEVVNDLSGELTNFWCVLQDEDLWVRFRRFIENVPFSETEYFRAVGEARLRTAYEQAGDFMVRCRQSLSGRMKGFAGVTRNRTRRGMNEQVSAWLNAIDGLPAVHER